jgi:hypothetical protein
MTTTRLHPRLFLFRCLLLFVGLLAALGCRESVGQPARPANVPAAAFWLGGADGGVFVLLNKPKTGKTLVRTCTGTIYTELGYVEFSGTFDLSPADGAPLDIADTDQFDFWGGTRLVVKGGKRSLVARFRRR